MAFDQIGLEAVLEGVSDFVSGGDAINDSVAALAGGLDLGAGIIGAAGDAIGGALSTMADLALSAASAAGSALIDFFSDSFSGALEAEQTIARLGQVIESTGGIAGVTVGEAEALADEFKHLAGGSDDAILSIVDMGLRMGTISEEEMPAFIQTTLDLGTVMGDAGRAAQLMARAQEDPLGVLGALRKQGILVTESTEAQMQAMVKAGDTAGAYALLMGVVETATAGAAETMAMTASGQWAIFTETIADAGESIMMAFLPALNGILASLTPLIPMVEMVAGSVATFFETVLAGGDVGTAFDNLAGGIYRAFGPEVGLLVMQFGDVVMGIYDFVVANIPLMQTTFEAVFTAIGGVFQVLSDFVTVTLMPAIASIWGETNIQLPTAQQTFENVMNAIVVVTQMVSDFITNVLVPAFTYAVDWTVANWPTIQATIETVIYTIQSVIDTVVTAIVAFWEANGEAIISNSISTWSTIQTTISTIITTVQNVITTVLTAIQAFWSAHGESIMFIVNTFMANTQASIQTAITIIQAVITTTLSAIQAFWDTWGVTIMAIVDNMTETIGAMIEAFAALLRGDWETLGTSLETIWSNTWENAGLTMSMAASSIGTIISDMVTAIGAAIVNFTTDLIAKWTALGASLTQGWMDAWVAIGHIVGTGVQSILSIDWASVGSSIISSIGTGISNAAGALAQQAADAAWAAYQAMLEALGIASPSPMIMAIGEQLNSDVARGIADTAIVAVRESERSARAIAAGMIDTLNERLSGRGIHLDALCQRLGREAERIGKECIPAGITQGLGTVGIDPFSQGGTVVGRGGIEPVSTGVIPIGGAATQTSNTYQYAPTYGSTPVSPERDFAMMQVLAGSG